MVLKEKLELVFFPPLALGYLAAPLIEKGYEIKIIDASPMDYTNEDIDKEVKIFKPDLIGISVVTANADEAYSLVNFLKKNYSNTPIILGGPHINCFPDLVFEKLSNLDMIVCGEGEKTFEKVVDYFIYRFKSSENIAYGFYFIGTKK